MKMMKEKDFRKIQRLIYDLNKLVCRKKADGVDMHDRISEVLPPEIMKDFCLEDLQSPSNVN